MASFLDFINKKNENHKNTKRLFEGFKNEDFKKVMDLILKLLKKNIKDIIVGILLIIIIVLIIYDHFSKDENVIRDIILSGADVIRINMSHASSEFARDVILSTRKISEELDTEIGIMIDTRGPEIRIGTLESDNIKLFKDKKVRIVKNNIVGNSDMFSVTLPAIIEHCKVGEKILINDGSVELEVEATDGETLICTIKNDGFIKSNCSINIPDANFNIKFLSNYDKDTIRFASMMEVDYLALSLVNSHLDVLDVNDLLIELDDSHIQIISKIENKNAIEEIDKIIKMSDGIMISRGDLGIEVELEKIPSLQKKIATKTKEQEKICIVATEMLASMQHSPRPTRAEVSDVANAVLDGTDAVMLSSETAIGLYPVETVKTMNKIIDAIENEIDYNDLLLEINRNEKIETSKAISYSCVDCANRVEAKAIVCSTMTGNTAKEISNYRPSCPVVAISPDEKVVRGLTINYGIFPVRVPIVSNTDEIINISVDTAKKIINLEEKDRIVIAGSFPLEDVKYTNFMKIEEIK